MVYYEITGDEMTPPEDKAPDMPLKNIKQMCADMETIETFLDGCAGRFVGDALHINIAELAKAIRARTPIQSPDQGAVEKLDLLQKRAYSHAEKSNSPKLMREWIDSDVEVIRQALTRTPLDLAGLEQPRLDTVTILEEVGDELSAGVKVGKNQGWNACLYHLQAIRPDWFGGK